MYEYEQKIWNGKKWEPTYHPARDRKYSEKNNEEIIDFTNLNWIECMEYCYNNIEYIEFKKTWREKIKIKIYTGDIFSNKYITLTEKNYKKFKIGMIYTKNITLKDKQKELIDSYIKSH